MKSRCIFRKLRNEAPLRLSSLLSPFKTIASPDSSFISSRYILNNYVGISLLLSSCGREGHLRLGSSLHASIIKNSEFFDLENGIHPRNALVVWNSLLMMYVKCWELSDAAKLFDDMPMRDTISCNTMISGLLRNREFERGLGYFRQMQESGICRLDQATLTTILSACDGSCLGHVNEMIHALVFLNGLEQETSVGNALITSYFKCERFSLGRQVFNEMVERNVITWTAMISGLVQNNFFEESLRLFVEMQNGSVEPNALTYLSSLAACSGFQALKEGEQIHGLVWKLGIQSDLCIESALMDMYSKCGSMGNALQIFDSAQALDEISMTVILVGFAQNGLEDEAVNIFLKMVKAGIDIDSNMVSAVLGIFGVDTSLFLGQQIHSLVIKKSFGSNIFVSNGLINMYSKCGNLEDARQVFKRMPHRNSISWNTMIASFARHGYGSETLQLYEEMRLEGVEPTDVTFLSLLHACSHVGLVDKGMELLVSMVGIYGISPRMEHYACVVDLLGRARLLNEAKAFIEGFPLKPGILVWQALLGACSIHGNPEIGKYAADQLALAAPNSPVPYISMANIYSSSGRWKERAGTIKRMKEMGVAKETGISWIEVEREVHCFVVGEQLNPKSMLIHDVLCELLQLMNDEGRVSDKRFIQYYLDQDEKEQPIL